MYGSLDKLVRHSTVLTTSCRTTSRQNSRNWSRKNSTTGSWRTPFPYIILQGLVEWRVVRLYFRPLRR